MGLHVEWGADEAIAASPHDRFRRPAPPARAPAAATAPATSLDAVRAALSALTDCPLQATATHLVFARGDPAARLMVVGEAPGEEEDRTGLAFSGAGGRLLEAMLGSIGIQAGSALLTYIVPWRPPGNRPPNETEIRQCLPFLRQQIALVRPARLLLLGGLPVRTLLGTPPRTNLSRLRGRWQTVSIEGQPTPVPALPTQHPDHLVAEPAAKRQAWADLLILRAALDEDAAGH